MAKTRSTFGCNVSRVVLNVFFLVCSSLSFSAEALWTCGSCDGGSSLSCPNSFDIQYTVSLYPYNDLPNRSLHLQCDYFTVNHNFSLLKGCSFPDAVYIRIEQCPLFNESVANVLTKIGVNVSNVQYLLWATSHSSNKGLQAWHLNGLHNLTFIQMQDNEFTSYPKEFLKETPKVEKLYMTGNFFNKLPSDILSYTPNLMVLDLGNNNLSILPNDLLINVPSLRILNIWSNRLTSIPANMLVNSKSITTIVISGNQLTSIEPELFMNLKNLSSVDLRHNKLQMLPESTFTGCTNLSSISLQFNILSYLPPNIFQDTALQILNLGYNALTNMTGVLNNIKTLQNVTLHKNKFVNLDANMFKGSSNIIRLDIQENSIKSLAPGIFNSLNKLKIVLLNNNELDELPSGLFRECLALLRIFMQKNRLTTIPVSTFPDYSDITKLDISDNYLTFEENSDINPLNKLTRIEYLYLANNRISRIFKDAMNVFTLLKHLDMRNNSINSLADTDLQFVSKNVTLLLQNNHIANITTSKYLGLGSNSEKFMYVNLAGNPLNCDCQMYNFLNLIKFFRPHTDSTKQAYNLIVQDPMHTFCSQPTNYLNVSLLNIDPTQVLCEFNCSSECNCNIRIHDRFLLMDCSNLALSHPPNLYLANFIEEFRELKLSLDLSNNDFEDISFLSNQEYDRLTNIDLTNNTLSELNETFLPEGLRFMDLRFNNFTTMSQGLVDRLNSSGMKLHLAENPWTCDCGLKSFHEFLRNNYELVIDRQQIVCSDGDGRPIADLSPEELCSFLYRPATLASIGIGALVMLLVTVLLTAAWYRHKELVKVWLYTNNMCLWAVTEQEIDADKKYDAFISYSYKDEGFVNNILVPGLESGEPKYRVCLHYRDWIPGEYIQDQILTSVKASRRTIVVLSKNFIESVWGQLEFKAAHSQALKDKTNRVIIIVYGDVPSEDELDGELKLYISVNTYLKWGDQKFWERLRYAMPHSKYAPYKKTNVEKLELGQTRASNCHKDHRQLESAPQTDIKTTDD